MTLTSAAEAAPSAELNAGLKACLRADLHPAIGSAVALHGWHWDAALCILPEDRIQLLSIGRIGPGKIHLRRFLCSGSFLFVHPIDKAAAESLVVHLLRRLRFRAR